LWYRRIRVTTNVAHNPRRGFAYEHLNLRFNPFGELDRQTRAHLAVVTVELQDGEILQFIGHSGRGKTTHLLALSRQLRDSHYEIIPEGSFDYQCDPRCSRYLFIDEAQRIRPRRLKQLMRDAHTLVLGTHDDLAHWSQRPVRTVRLCGIDPAQLAKMLQARIEHARRGPGRVPTVPPAVVDELIKRHGDNIRAIENNLYDRLQRLNTIDDNWTANAGYTPEDEERNP